MFSHSGWGLQFYDCINNNDLEKLETLVEQHRIDLNDNLGQARLKKDQDLSPIHLVACKGYTGMLQYLYDMKCDIHATTSILKRTAFHFSVLRHKVACFHKLLAFGVNPDPRDTFGNSPCHYAAEDGAIDILVVLLRQRVDIDAQDITNKTPLMKATRNGKIIAMKKLIAAGCNLNIRDKNSDTALHFAARNGRPQLISVLLSAGSDANLQNQWGNTPLMEAANYNNKGGTELLLKAGCEVNQRESKGGETALHICVKKNYTIIIDQLLATGQVHYIYNYLDELAIYHAVLNQHIDTIKLFIKYNYDFDRAVKLEYDGTGWKTVIQISLQRSHFETLRLLSQVGYVISYCSKVPPKPVGPAALFLVAQPSRFPPSHLPDVPSITRFLADIHIVRLLKQMCRKSIRKLLGQNIYSKVKLLPIPNLLKDYLVLQDVEAMKGFKYERLHNPDVDSGQMALATCVIKKTV